MNRYSNLVTPLSDLAVIEISGEDAPAFLHGQLTQDIANLPADHARLAGYCTAKGRLLATMVVWLGPQADGPVIYALVKADIADSFIKRLSMFVLRAKVKLRVADVNVWGIMTDATSALRPAGGPADLDANQAQSAGWPARLLREAAVLSAQPQAWQVARTATGTWIAAPSADAGRARWWLVSKDAQGAGQPPAADALAVWQAADITAGLPWVQAATQDVFIPQTLNLDLIDGVSFSKGCYPGQEVVARSHYRGTVKRRMAAGAILAPRHVGNNGGLAGLDVFDAKKPAAPCGRIINAATDLVVRVLMEVQLADLRDADFRLGGADGPKIECQPLPYAITTG
ncbi:MAG TPA: folate-binding protein [Candidimonas sp.]|nr:folate-binding protein [Candidimonas sp.]